MRLMTLCGAWSISTSLAHTASTTDAMMHSGISRLSIPRPTAMGLTRAVQPTIISMLKMLLPTTLPTAMSALPCRADRMLMTSSGADVPKATIVRPMTRFEIPYRLAMAAAPSVNALAPSRMSASPPTTVMMLMAMSMIFLVIDDARKFTKQTSHSIHNHRLCSSGRRCKKNGFLSRGHKESVSPKRDSSLQKK